MPNLEFLNIKCSILGKLNLEFLNFQFLKYLAGSVIFGFCHIWKASSRIFRSWIFGKIRTKLEFSILGRPNLEFPNLKRESHFKKGTFFVHANKNLGLYFGHSQKFQAQKCRFSLWNSSARKPEFRSSLRGRHFEQYSVARPLFGDVIQCERVCSNHFRQAFQLQLGYCWPWITLFWAKHTPNSEMIALKIVKCIIAWKRKILVTLRRMPSQLQVFLLPANFEQDGNDVT